MSEWPRVGVGMLIVRDNRILLAQRKKKPEAGHWGILGGKLEQGEKLREAAIREAEEESGLRITSTEFLTISEQIGLDDQHWVSGIYLATEFDGEAHITEPQSFQDMAWFNLDDLPENLTKAANDALQRFNNYE